MLTTLLVGPTAARAQTPWYEGFEGPEPTWRTAGGDAQFRVLAHQRVQDAAFTGRGCEHLAISAGAGTHVYFGHDVGRPRVIDELLPTVRIKSDREGLRLLARVVLPRTTDPQSGRPLTTLVHGTSYTAIGRYQQLRIEELPQQLARRTRVLRAEYGPQVDPREAYVDGILLNVYGGPGLTHVWIDDLDIGGYVAGPQPAPPRSSAADGGSGASSPAPPAPQLDTTGWTGRRSEPGRGAASPRIELVGSVLLVDGRPFFPRMIQYRGEPLALIERLGFNTIWLDELPSAEVLDESARLGLWLVCPPPSPTRGNAPPGDPTPPTSIGPGYERVLAWNLGRGLPAGELEALKQRAAQIRAADRGTARPLICGPASDLRTFSRYVDVLLLGRSPLGTSLELREHGTWLRERPRLARPGKAIWTTVQTQPDPSILRQWAALGLAPVPSTAASSEQIRLLTYTAVTAGARALLFESHHPLDPPDAATRNRTLALELLNLELTLIEPWLAAGDLVTSVQGSQPEVLGSLLRTDHARLLVSVWSGPGGQFVPGQSAANCVSLVLPGIPESDNAYRLAPGTLEPLRPKRVTGGTRVTLDEFGLTSLVLLTGEPLVISDVRQRAQVIARRAAQLQRELAAAKLQAVEQVHPQASPDVISQPRSVAWLAAAREGIRAADAALATRDYARAYDQAQRAMCPLRLVERADWEPAVGTLFSPVSHPAAISFATLPAFRTLARQIASTQPRANLVEPAHFDDLETMLHAGWRHFQRSSAQVYAEAELASKAAHSGRFGLRLTARPADGGDSDVLIETPPCWVTGPAVRVEAGQMVCIHGWVQVPAPITGSVDGLLIVDSLSGEPLAQRIVNTTGWQEFTLYRMAAGPETLTVTFALSGLGEAWIDDVTIQSIPIRRPVGPPLNVGRLPAESPR